MISAVLLLILDIAFIVGSSYIKRDKLREERELLILNGDSQGSYSCFRILWLGLSALIPALISFIYYASLSIPHINKYFYLKLYDGGYSERLQDISFVFQEYNLIESLTVYENLSMPLALERKPVIADEIDSIMDMLGIKKLKNRRINELSGGEKERVAIARALVKNANILLCDEPTGSLDRENVQNIFSLLKSLSTKLTVIVVSHDKDSALKFADRIVELEYRRIISDKRYNEARNKEVSYAKAITPRIPLGFISKLSFKYMLKSILMTALSLIMLIMLVFSLGLSISLQVRNEDGIIAEAMDAIGIKTIGVKKEIRYTDSNGDTGNRFYCMRQNEVGELEESLNEKLYSVHSFKKGGSINNVSSG